MDESEFSTLIPTIGAALNYFFYKVENIDNNFLVNIDKPLINIDSDTYTLKTRMYHDPASTSEAFGYVKVTIVPDCSIETVTPAAIADITYTFNAVATSSVLPAFTSSFPSKCLIEYSL